MATIRTFADADVLIWAARGREFLSQAAMRRLTEENREFVGSDFLRLEVIPKAAFHEQFAETAFYERFFAAAVDWVESSPSLLTQAESQATQYGLSAVDTLHVAAAKAAGAQELITAERSTSPLFRVEGIAVISIRPDAVERSENA